MNISLNSGGKQLLLDQGGRDATEPFDEVEHSEQAYEILEGLQIGTLKYKVYFTPPKLFSRFGI
jgi:cytochrome b involved in lipid metabolism